MAWKIFNIGKANEEIARLEKENEALQSQIRAAQENADAVAKAADGLRADLDTTTKERDELKAKEGTFTVEIQQKTNRIAELQAIIDKPDGEIERRAGIKSREICAQLGVPALALTPDGSGAVTGGSLAAQMEAITDPNARTAFFRKHETALKAEARSLRKAQN